MLEGFGPNVVDTLGGLCTLMERSDLPAGLSPLAKNVRFFPGGVQSRGGFKTYMRHPSLHAIGWSEPPVDGYWGVSDFVDGYGFRNRLFYLGGKGSVRGIGPGWGIDYPPTNVIAGVGFSGTFSTMKTAALYGKAYTCLSDGRRGIAAPLQIGGLMVASALASSGASAATASTAAGSMTNGLYHIAVAFETASGYISGSAEITSVSLSGGKSISLTGIPIGPPGTEKRRIFLSLADSFDLYNPPGLTLNNNTTTTLSGINLSQAEIAAGLPFSEFMSLTPPANQLGVAAYSNRVVYWGGDGRLSSFLGPTTTSIVPTYRSIGLINLSFSSQNAASYAWPTVAGEYGGWYSAVTNVSVVAGSAFDGELSNYLRITSTAAATDGLVRQGYDAGGTLRNNVDAIGTYYLQPNRKYGLRVRARRDSTAAAGNLVVKLYENNALVSRTLISSYTIPVTSMAEYWTVFEQDGNTAVTGLTNVSIEVYLSSVTNAATIDVSDIEVYDTSFKRGGSTLSISRVDDPESFDAVNGAVTVSPNDGQEIRSVFVLHGNLYVAKEESLYVLTDNGNEPAYWSVECVSSVVGTPSVHGAQVGDNFAVIAGKDGLYLTTGGSPEKISQEIQPTWDLFDWSKGERIFVAVHTGDKYVIVGGPTSTGYQQLRLDFVEGFGDPIGGGGHGRKWSTDTRFTGTPATETGVFTSAGVITLDSGAKVVAYCSADDSTRITYEDEATLVDYSGNIQSYYETAPIGMEAGRSLFGALLHKIRGSGTLLSWFVRPDGTTTALSSKTLSSSPLHDVEIRTQQTDTQLGLRIGTYGAGHYFIAKRLSAWLKRAPFSFARGY